MTIVSELRAKAEGLQSDLLAIEGGAKAAGRDLNLDEGARVDAIVEQAQALRDTVAKHADDADLKRQILALGEGIGVGDPSGPTGVGFARRMGQKTRGDHAWSAAYIGRYGTKALTTSGNLAVPSPILDPVRLSERPRFVSDLIPSEAVEGSVAPYFRQTARTNAADAVAAGDPKPESAYTIERVEGKIATVAHIVDGINRADLADAAFLRDFLDAEMRLGLRLAIDDQIVNGDGLLANLAGILATSGIQVQAYATSVTTTLRKALTKLQIANVEPTGLVINPADAEVLDLLTDGEVRGYWGGPVQSGSSPVWSVPVVVTPVIAAGAALMGDFAGSARIFSREEAVVDFTEALGFKSNTVTFRAEARVGVGVLRPLAFVEVDLTA